MMTEQRIYSAALALALTCALARPSRAQEAPPEPVSPAGSAPALPPPAATLPPSAPPPSTAPAGPLLSLEQALRVALERHPRLGQARAATRVAGARADQALSGYLPQVRGTASYRRTEAQVRGNGIVGQNLYLAELSASQLIYDFGQTSGRYRAASSNLEALQQNETVTRQEVTLAVKNAYLQAHAQKALLDVSRETLANQLRHLAQVEGFVEVGTRPRIDLVQAQSDVESARLSLVNTENAYAVARAQLAQAMGLEVPADFEVSDQGLAPVAEEGAASADLFRLAIANRAELKAQAALTRSQEQTLRAVKGAYGPTLSVSTGIAESGPAPDSLSWSWNAQATLNWNLFQGGLTRAQVAEAHANLDSVTLQTASLRQQIFVEVEQARLGVRAAKQALSTADKLVANTRERLNLAEGRYQVGAGSILELADAQLALTTAQAQRVQADYMLSAARAALTKALGRE